MSGNTLGTKPALMQSPRHGHGSPRMPLARPAMLSLCARSTGQLLPVCGSSQGWTGQSSPDLASSLQQGKAHLASPHLTRPPPPGVWAGRAPSPHRPTRSWYPRPLPGRSRPRALWQERAPSPPSRPGTVEEPGGLEGSEPPSPVPGRATGVVPPGASSGRARSRGGRALPGRRPCPARACATAPRRTTPPLGSGPQHGGALTDFTCPVRNSQSCGRRWAERRSLR